MQTTVERPDPCTVVLDISVDEQQVAGAFDSAYREFGRYANVPGFRPGKAPRALLERYLNTEKVRERALEKLITDCYVKAIEEQKIDAYRGPEIDRGDLEDRKPFSFKATVPLPPHVELGQYTGITVERPRIQVTDEIVNERLEKLRQDCARLERVADRGIQADDVVIAEDRVAIEGDEDAGTTHRQLIRIGHNIPGFDDAVMGTMPGEERTFELTYPDDFDDPGKRGKRATFTVKVLSISARRVPDLDDAFAKQALGVETLEELRSRLRDGLVTEFDRLSDQMAMEHLVAEIVRRSRIAFPQILLREEVQDKLREVVGAVRAEGVTYEAYLQHAGMTQEEHQANLATEADASIRALLVLREIAQEQSMLPTDEAIDAEFDRLLKEDSITQQRYDESIDDPRRRLTMANTMVHGRLREYLFANNTLQTVEERAADQRRPEAESKTPADVPRRD